MAGYVVRGVPSRPYTPESYMGSWAGAPTPTNWPWAMLGPGMVQAPHAPSVLPQGQGFKRAPRRRSSGSGLARGLNRMQLESGQVPQLVKRPARFGMAAGGYGYKVESRAPQTHPLMQAMQEMMAQQQGQPQQVSPWQGVPTGQIGGPPAAGTTPPATALPRSHGRIAPPERPLHDPFDPGGQFGPQGFAREFPQNIGHYRLVGKARDGRPVYRSVLTSQYMVVNPDGSQEPYNIGSGVGYY